MQRTTIIHLNIAKTQPFGLLASAGHVNAQGKCAVSHIYQNAVLIAPSLERIATALHAIQNIAGHSVFFHFNVGIVTRKVAVLTIDGSIG